MKILDCRELAKQIDDNIKTEVDKLSNKPKLAIINVGDNLDNLSYQNNAKKKMESLGIECFCYNYNKNITTQILFDEINKINNSDINGILVLQPLPKHINPNILQSINPNKDIDCITYNNLGKLFVGNPDFIPCTSLAVIEILNYFNIDVNYKNVVIIGRSNTVSKPLAHLLTNMNGTVTLCHSYTQDLQDKTLNSDIIISACGQAKYIDNNYIKDNQIVIDVGINFIDNKICGDINIETLSDLDIKITPVPFGVGSITTSILAKQVLQAYNEQNKKE